MLGIGTSLRSSRGLRSSVAFNPAALFGLTDTGWFYDHSDFSTLFQDAAGTIPVTAVGQPVGRQLDTSKGLVLGPELITNGTFDTDTSGWTAGAGTSIAATSGEFVVTNSIASGFGRSFQAISCVVGKHYKVEGLARVISASSGRAGMYLVNASNVFIGPSTAEVSSTSLTAVSMIFQASATTHYLAAGVAGVGANAGATFGFDNISVKELAGNHRTQPISLNRPTLRQDGNGLYYLEYDGINDSMATASFAWGTDKATVVAGVRKLSDAAGARTIVETSTNSDSTNGTFRLGTDAATFTWRSRGTVSADTSGAGAQPITAVLTGIGDIAGDVARLRRNAAQVGEVLTDQGTGNLLTYPAHFGARAGTSLFFNGREYSQFAINRLLTTAELAQIEAYTAGKTGVVL